MVLNSESLKAKINNMAKKYNVMPQDLMQMYFFERLLYRISVSPYKHNFILKGGLLLSALFGNNRRTTQDMDTMIKGIDINSEELITAINEIINIDANDGITFTLLNSKDIRKEDRYGGIRLSLIAVKQHLNVNLKIDITTKDPITPREIDFKYKSMFDDSYIKIMAFTKETIIAEKFETLMEDTESDTRAKDFYDMYMLMNESINTNTLKKALVSTFKRRNKEYILDELEERFELISHSKILENYWQNYQKSHIYSQSISYDEIMNTIKKIIEITKIAVES